MAVTLNAIDIESIVSIHEINRPKISSTSLGYHSLALNQGMKGTVHQYQISCIWSGGNTDFTNKKAKVQNIADSGLPVWFDASDWSTNTILFGRVSDLDIVQSDGRVDIWDVSFLITSVFPWGYTFITSDGNGDFRIYDTLKVVQSRTLNPLLRHCSYTLGSVASLPTTLVYSFYIKNVHASASGLVKIELMVPDGLGTGSISCSQAVTEVAGNIGDSGISNTPGTKRRITMTRTLAAGVEELWTITITISSLKTSYLDGSIDDIAA